MKRFAWKSGLVIGLLLVFVAGCVVGLMGASWLWYRHVYGRQVDEVAVALGMNVARASQLRLGEVDAALDALEMGIDAAVVSVGLNPLIPITELRQRQLRAAKTYREIYPSRSEGASQVTEALAKVERIALDEFKCNSSLYRLVKEASSQKEEEAP